MPRTAHSRGRSRLRASSDRGCLAWQLQFQSLWPSQLQFSDTPEVTEVSAMTTNGVGTLNSLLRGELAATETYQQALAKVGNDPKAADLRRIHVEHRTA